MIRRFMSTLARRFFFITICCKKRGANQLCYPEVASLLFQATQFYQRQQRWFVSVLLLMPDHVHFLASFSIDVKMTNVVASWKRFTSKHAKINWQRDFFDHRRVETKVGAKKATTSCGTLFGLG